MFITGEELKDIAKILYTLSASVVGTISLGSIELFDQNGEKVGVVSYSGTTGEYVFAFEGVEE